MRLKNINYNSIAQLDVESNRFADVVDIALSLDYSIKTIRELDMNGKNAQRETNIVAGLFDMVNGYGCQDLELMSRLNEHIEPLLESLRGYYGYSSVGLKSLCFIKMDSNTKIYPHIDDEARDIDTAYNYCHRIHIPLVTNDKVIFTIGGEDRHLKLGEVIEIDNLTEHSVVNNGSTDRIHLLIDFYGLHGYYDVSLPEIPDEFYQIRS